VSTVDLLDLTSRLDAQRAFEAAAAGGPVRYVTQAFIDALQGSWGELRAIEPEPQRLAR
jgi:hypothetical protein